MTNNTTLSIFVDESGNLPLAGTNSRFYIVSLVAHNQQESIDKPVRELDEAFARMGLPNLCFHAGPLIRREDGYKYMGWEMRNRIFAAMMAFARKAPFRYRSICVDKKFVASEKQIVSQLKVGISEFLDAANLHDLVSSVSLIAQKLQSGIGLTKSEEKFFGGARNFKRNVLRPILKKKI